MTIVFFNRFFHPDGSATSQILSDLAFHLATRGHSVRVVTSGEPRGIETIRGVMVHRVAKSVHRPGGLAGRAVSYIAYHARARAAARKLIDAGDVVVIKTDPPMLGASIAPIARRRGARVVHWLQDLFPEVAERHGVPGIAGPVAAWLRTKRDRALASADCNVAIGERMARFLGSELGSGARVTVIHNWADGRSLRPVAAADNALRTQWGLQGAFVVGYSGNLGRVHEFDTLLGAARELRGDPSIRFVVVGRGPRLAEVMRRARELELDNVRFEPHQPREQLSQSLGTADVHVVTLAPEYEGLVHPSKLYGIMAAGRPVIFVGDPAGEVAAILEQTASGRAVRAGDVAGLVRAIVAMRDDRASIERMGSAARAAFERMYDAPVAFERWEMLLRGLS